MRTLLLSLLALLTHLTISTALQPTLEKTLFFLDGASGFSSQLFRTKHGSISFSGENTPSLGYVPQYLLIDFNPVNVTRILTDIMTSCDNRIYLFSKLYYHEQTSSLVYYCTNNNTLLTLDEDDFTVQDSIPIEGMTNIFEETKLSGDGNSLVVIGINGMYANDPSPSQFIRINLATKEVTDNVTLDKGLSSNEVVVGYAASGSKSYVITNQFDFSANMSVYSFDLSQNTYKLTHLTTSTYEYSWPYGSAEIPQIYCVGDLVATNADGTLIFINQKGEIVYNVSGLAYNRLPFKTDNVYSSQDPIFSRGRGDNTLYASIVDDIRNPQTLLFTVEGESISSEVIANAALKNVIIGNNKQEDLLFTAMAYDKSNSFSMLNVIDTRTSNTIYSMVPWYQNIMTTKSTYAVRYYSTIAVYNFTNDALLGVVSLIGYDTLYYHDVDSGFLYTLNNTFSSISCHLAYVDLENAYSEEIYSFNDANICTGAIIQVNASSNPQSPELLIQAKDGSFLIISNTFGQVNFSLSSNLQQSYIVPDFDTLSVYQIAFDYDIFGGWYLYQYDYNHETKSFTTKSSLPLDNMEYGSAAFAYYYFGDGRVFAVSDMVFTEVNLTTGTTAVYTLLEHTPTLSMLYDGSHSPFVILSNDPSKGARAPLYLFDSNGLGPLPGAGKFSVNAEAAGYCKYYVGDGLISNVRFVKIFDVCAKTGIIYQ